MRKVITTILIVLALSSVVAASGFNASAVNWTKAFAGANNISQFNYTFNNTDYPIMSGMINYNESKTESENLITMIFSPISQYWASAEVFGYWFYVLLIVGTVLVLYGKTKSLEVASMAMMMLSLLIAVPGATGMIIVPDMVLNIMYMFTGLAFAGVLLGFFGGED